MTEVKIISYKKIKKVEDREDLIQAEADNDFILSGVDGYLQEYIFIKLDEEESEEEGEFVEGEDGFNGKTWEEIDQMKPVTLAPAQAQPLL